MADEKQPETINRICPECNKVSQYFASRYNDLDEQINCGKCGSRNALGEWGEQKQSKGESEDRDMTLTKNLSDDDFDKLCDECYEIENKYKKQPRMKDVEQVNYLYGYNEWSKPIYKKAILVEDSNTKLDEIISWLYEPNRRRHELINKQLLSGKFTSEEEKEIDECQNKMEEYPHNIRELSEFIEEYLKIKVVE